MVSPERDSPVAVGDQVVRMSVVNEPRSGRKAVPCKLQSNRAHERQRREAAAPIAKNAAPLRSIQAKGRNKIYLIVSSIF